MLTTGQAAALLGCCPQHVRKLARRGELPYEETPYGRLFAVADVNARLANKPRPGRPPRGRGAAPGAEAAGASPPAGTPAGPTAGPLASSDGVVPAAVRLDVFEACSVVGANGRVQAFATGVQSVPAEWAGRLLATRNARRVP